MENRKTQILDLTLKLIREKGYVAISYDDLSRPLGVTKASIHYHFEKKEDLGIAVVDRIMNRFEELNQSSASLQPAERLQKFFADRVKVLGCHDICPLSSLQSDFESLQEKLQEKVKEASALEISILSGILSDMQNEGTLPSTQNIESLAVTLLASVKGAMQYQRVLGKEVYPDVMKQLSRLL